MATLRPPPSRPLDLELTIISAKHLKNVNWRNGDLKPYVVFWVDPDRKLATKSDDSGSTKPVWNERFTIPLTLPLDDSALTIEVFHSKPSETPKPLVGTVRIRIGEFGEFDGSSRVRVRAFQLARPSGRPQGKISLKLALRDRPLPPPQDYHIAPNSSYYYSSAPDYRGYSPSPAPAPVPSPSLAPPLHYGSYSGYYSAMPPLPLPRPCIERQSSYSGPSAPVDYSQYDQRKSGKMGLGAGLTVGAVAGALGGMALDEGLKYEEQKIGDQVESDLGVRDEYSIYRADY